jgi:hypothetical protein
MTIHDQKEAGYITLKEASERFGYAPDYIGQLIRKGKIEGKQVHANVAWMTTAEAMEEYLAEAGEKRAAKSEPQPSKFSFGVLVSELSLKLFSSRMTRILRVLFWVLSALLVLALLFVFYLLATQLDRASAERAQMRLDAEQELRSLQISESQFMSATHEYE